MKSLSRHSGDGQSRDGQNGEFDEAADTAWLAIRDSFSPLVSAAPHELIGPLNQASSLIALFASRHKDQDGGEAETLISLLDSATQRMQNTVAGLKIWFEVAGGSHHRDLVDMNQVLRMALYLTDVEIKKAGASISFGELPEVYGDADRLTELFRILVGNAVKFRRREVPCEVRISSKQSDGIWAFSVADNGIGISPDYRADLFRPFRKLNGHTWPGAGLGLATAKMIVDIHNGSIWVDSDPGGIDPEGTVFSFALGTGSEKTAEHQE